MTVFRDKMIKRVAREVSKFHVGSWAAYGGAVHQVRDGYGNGVSKTFTREVEAHDECAILNARAAIRAVLDCLREPSDEMQKAGTNAVLKQRAEDAGGCFSTKAEIDSCECGHCNCWNVGELDWQESYLATLDAADPDKEKGDV